MINTLCNCANSQSQGLSDLTKFTGPRWFVLDNLNHYLFLA